MDVEKQISNQMFTKDHEKSFIDKLLSRKEIEEIRQLIKKPRLSRSELLELLYLIGSAEQKLLNYDQWNRYVILKYYVWLREFISICELWFDLNDQLVKDEVELDDKEKKLMNTSRDLLEHNAKFLVDLFLNIGRTSLSVNATGFFELMRNKFEMTYNTPPAPKEPRTNILGLGLGK